ncbi:MAG: GAF domain-containing protein [Flavobacteriia bacterium]|nr:GAF domain-containing protein [Flavobacteriia bacterium]NBX38332.1 GAF domain-containing protein [Flavobacteriia bacterium]
MSASLFVHSGEKNEKYQALLQQIPGLLDPQVDVIANMANVAAALRETFGFFWVGFYRVVGEQLVLGPYQGPLACTRIAFGKGVCGASWEQQKTLVVANVHEFPGHIACSEASKSEIVVPIMVDGQVVAVLDIDSDEFATFDDIDRESLEKICTCLSELYP